MNFLETESFIFHQFHHELLYSEENDFVDSDKLAIWGWSFGGFATSHVAAYPEGAELFSCAVAVAPLTSRLYYRPFTKKIGYKTPKISLNFIEAVCYDTLWSEITMGLPSDNAEGYKLAEIWSNDMRGYRKLKYTVIHGTGDDNVHFQNSARLTKELIGSGAEFNAYFYADEAHSINYRGASIYITNRKGQIDEKITAVCINLVFFMVRARRSMFTD